MAKEDIIWNTNCDALEDYHRRFGTCNCHVRTVCVLPNGRLVKLGKWLNTQRTWRKGTNGSGLLKEREARLQSLVDQGKLLWEMKDVRDWNFMYGVLVDYGRRYGTCNVPHGWKEKLPSGEVVNLGKWLNYQRMTQDTYMSLDHKRRLNELAEKGLFRWRMVSSLGFIFY